MKPGVSGTGHTSSVATPRKDGHGCASANWIAGKRLWKNRCVENQKQVFHCAWKSRKRLGTLTFPQPRRRTIDHEPDISRATTTGHVNFVSIFLKDVDLWKLLSILHSHLIGTTCIG